MTFRIGATEDEFGQAGTPILERTREQVLEWPLKRTSDFGNTTHDNFNALISELFPGAKTIRFTAAM